MREWWWKGGNFVVKYVIFVGVIYFYMGKIGLLNN